MSRCEGCVFPGEYRDMGLYAKCCDRDYHYTRSLNTAIEMCEKEDPCEHKVTFDDVYEYEKMRGATADVVEVVRCKDCEHYEAHGNGKSGLCKNKKCKGIRYENDFCSYGERKEQ